MQFHFWVKIEKSSFKTFFDPRYRPPTPVLVDSEVRGTTLQKLIVDSKVRVYDSTKVIVDSVVRLQKLIVAGEVRGTTLQKLIVKSESESEK